MMSLARAMARRGYQMNGRLANHLEAPKYLRPLCYTQSPNLIQPQVNRWQSTDSSSPPKSDEKKTNLGDKYIIKFKKGFDVKETFKRFYSLYGPLFVACHIGVSLASLGTFVAIIWPMVDPLAYLPNAVILAMGNYATSATQGGGKFVVAYALHKLILPIRLSLAIWLTQRLAPRIKLKRWWKANKSN